MAGRYGTGCGVIEVPAGLVETQIRFNGEAGRAFVAALPGLAERFLEEWELRLTGPVMHGVTSLVLPVAEADGTPAALKLRLPDEESEGEAAALRVWDGKGAVRLLAEDPGTGTLLLEWLGGGASPGAPPGGGKRHLSETAGTREATRILAEVLARLVTAEAPAGMRRLEDITARMLDRVPRAVESLADEDDRRLLRDCAAAVREVAGEPGDRLLHWDLHFDNVLAGEREPWVAIDPKPLAGDPGFELMPALWNRFEPGEVLWRFDLMTEVLGLDRGRARAWTLGRVLQNCLWELAGGKAAPTGEQVSVGRILLAG